MLNELSVVGAACITHTHNIDIVDSRLANNLARLKKIAFKST